MIRHRRLRCSTRLRTAALNLSSMTATLRVIFLHRPAFPEGTINMEDYPHWPGSQTGAVDEKLRLVAVGSVRWSDGQHNPGLLYTSITLAFCTPVHSPGCKDLHLPPWTDAPTGDVRGVMQVPREMSR
jgi:hypothetical protein